MNTLLKLTLLSTAIVLTIPLFAMADDHASEAREGVVDRRQERQEKRIEQGEASGQLTKREAKRLENQQKHTQKLEDKAMADGEMSKKEFRRMQHAQNKSSHSINRKKHNRRK